MTRYVIASEDYLQHHGIKFQRWGIRRFQPYPKGYKGNGKEIGEAAKVKQRPSRKEMRKQKKALRKSIKEQNKQLNTNQKILQNYEKDYNNSPNKQKGEDMVQKAIEQKKQKAIASGNVNKILKYKDQMSNKELEDAIKRTKLLNELKDLSVSDKKSAKNTFDKAVDKSSKKKDKKDDKKDKDLLSKMKKVNDYASTGISMYNNANQIIKIAKKVKKKKQDKS